MWLWSRERRRRLAEQRAALERNERLGEAIELIAAEGQEVAAWAQKTCDENHLAELFAAAARGRRTG